jgi:hypothetical protein
MINRRFPQDGKHHSEPEIIPPGRFDIREARNGWGWAAANEHETHRIYVTRTGPFGLLPFFLLAGVIGAVLFFFMLGAFLILIPAAGVILAAAVFGRLLQGRSSRWPR